jgi:hypothetical protein
MVGGSIRGSRYVGGVVGINTGGTITSSFALTISAADAVGSDHTHTGATLITSTAMRTLATFSEADLAWSISEGATTDATTWKIVPGLSTPYLAWQTPAPGDGSDAQHPIPIASLEDLRWLSETTDQANVWSKHYEQTADIDATATEAWNSNQGFSPIGNDDDHFTGTYNGGGHTITGLTINRTANYVGLFGYVYGSGARVEQLGMVGGSIRGSRYVGGVVGVVVSYSTVTSCYATGTVTGNSYVGGVVGSNNASATVSRCYATGTVSGSDHVGGVVGNNDGTISSSFALTTSAAQPVGSGSSTGATLITPAQMKALTTFTGAVPAWSINAEGATWKIDNALCYPYLAWQPSVSSPGAAVAVSGIAASYPYQGTPHEPAPSSTSVVLGGKTLSASTDYAVAYGANTTVAQGGAVMVVGKGKYGGGVRTNTFHIDRAELTVTADNTSRAYGDDNPELTVSYEGLVNGETADVISAAPTAVCLADGATAADTEVSITVSGGTAANYSVSYVPGALTVTRKPIAQPAASTDLVYTGEPQTGVPAGTGYSITGVNEATNAGPYTATLTLGSNYQWSAGEDVTLARDVEWSIAKADGVGSVSIEGWVFGLANDPVPSTTNDVDDVDYSYAGASALGVNYPASPTPPTNAGTYTVTATFAATTNFNEVVSEAYGFAITPAAGTFGTPDELSATYTPTLTLAGIAPADGYTWVAPGTLVSAGDGQTFSATYTDPSGNYYTSAPGDLTVNVGKADGAGSFGAPLPLHAAYTTTLTLADITLAPGYAWSDDLSTPVSAGIGQTFAATYTHPSGNYTAAEGEFTVNVDKAAAPNPPTTATATYGQTLAEIEDQLPSGWAWYEAGATAVGNAPSAVHGAKYEATANYAEGLAMVTVAITPVDDNTPMLGGTVAIVGSATFGETLTAVTTELTFTLPAPDATLSYVWKRGAATITTATTSTYTLTAEDIGSAITVTVTASGCTGSVTSAATSAVAKAPAPSAPTTATAIYGQTLADIAEQLSEGWAWDEVGGTAVGNAPSAYHPATYAATPSHAEGRASVAVTIARKPIAVPTANTGVMYDGTAKTGVVAGTGYAVSGENMAIAVGSYTATVTPDGNHEWDEGDDVTLARDVQWSIMPVDENTPVLAGTVAISGAATFGETLTAVTTGLTFAPAPPDTTLRYEWKRGAATITAANSLSYALTAEDVGTAITVTVTASGCVGSVTSAAVFVSKAPAPNAPTTATATYGQTLADIEDQLPEGWAWYEVATTAVGNAPSAVHAAKYEATANYAEGLAMVTVTIAPVSDNTPQLGGTVAISGAATYGETLTAVTTGLTFAPAPPDTTLSYTWKRGATFVGANSATYTLTAADVGGAITVTVTASGCAGSVTSAAPSRCLCRPQAARVASARRPQRPWPRPQPPTPQPP